jgi:hypothetical protein
MPLHVVSFSSSWSRAVDELMIDARNKTSTQRTQHTKLAVTARPHQEFVRKNKENIFNLREVMRRRCARSKFVGCGQKSSHSLDEKARYDQRLHQAEER